MLAVRPRVSHMIVERKLDRVFRLDERISCFELVTVCPIRFKRRPVLLRDLQIINVDPVVRLNLGVAVHAELEEVLEVVVHVRAGGGGGGF